MPDTPEAVGAFREEIDPEFPTGLSESIGSVSRVPDAYREAQWALQGAKATEKPMARYGEGSAHSRFMPRSLWSAYVLAHVVEAVRALVTSRRSGPSPQPPSSVAKRRR